jgi:hypothetical protein
LLEYRPLPTLRVGWAGTSCEEIAYSGALEDYSRGREEYCRVRKLYSLGLADNLCACPRAGARGQTTCARVREAVRVADDLWACSSGLCARPATCALIREAVRQS